MHAAVVNTWGEAPKYSTFNLPPPASSQVRVKVLTAGVHNLVRSRASGKHFTTAGKNPPHIPGTDGVGRLIGSNELVYFNCLTSPTGSLAEEINIEKQDVFPLAKDADPETVAVLANPAMSSWMALVARTGVKKEERFKVAIVGATGVSGQAAVQIAKALGATEIVAIGKSGAKLEKTKELGATTALNLAEHLEETDFSAAGNVDVVLDYLWGDVARAAIKGIISKRKNPNQRLTWVEIGALAGEDCAIPASILRKANIAFAGCGPGSWTFPELNQQLPTMLSAISENKLQTEFVVRRLEDVENWWDEKGGQRVVVKL